MPPKRNTKSAPAKHAPAKHVRRKKPATRSCKSCAKRFPVTPRGRPKDYCSTACRRANEFEIRRLNSRIARLEDRASANRLDPIAMAFVGFGDGGLVEEIELQKARLRELLKEAD